MIWDNHEEILPKSQVGFRKEWACMDNVFILPLVIQLQLRLPCTLLSTVRLTQYNVPGFGMNYIKPKNDRNLQELVQSCHFPRIPGMRIIEESNVTQGLFQGETLSPILFSIFLYDIEVFEA